ncbi:putative protein [Hydrogenobaculum sp. Y04AAS1]|uniref:hypothetical protein n=1 Tax=Hydrogenobaculum sp. (strain Y04AAS1) TaxID=380749 RepID=UPI00015BD47B|nr:putative protein [Hydrogenobaculum sp. Y04AAS1]HCT66412.1 hypothetical protein [Hydrogenobaculum sp.]
MKKLIIPLYLFLVALSYAQSFCIKEKSGAFIEDPYIKEYVIKSVEEAFIEAKKPLDCNSKSYKTVFLKVTNLSDMPIGYSIYQRANNYILNLSIELNIANKKYTYFQSSYYALPTGGEGDLPKRQALEDAMDRIKDMIIEDLLK